VDAVGDGAVVVERGEDELDGVQHVVDAADVEEGLLLAGEGRVRQVLGRRAGAHGEADLGSVVTVAALVLADEAVVRLADVALEVGREGLLLDLPADVRAHLRELAGVVDVEVGQQRVDAVGEPVLGEEAAVRVGRGREPVGHGDAGGGQVLHHLPQRGVLAAHDLDVGEAEVGEPHHVLGHCRSFHRWWGWLRSGDGWWPRLVSRRR
jgi:hypothetical protein